MNSTSRSWPIQYSYERATVQQPNITALRAVFIIFVAAAISFLFDAQENVPVLYYPGMLLSLAVLASILILPRRLMIFPILILLTIAPDLTQSASDIFVVGFLRSATIWQFKLGPVQPSWIIFAVFVLATFRLPKKKLSLDIKRVISYFAVVPVLTSVIYGFINDNLSMVVSDLKLPLFLVLGLIFFNRFYKAFPDEFMRSLIFGFLALCGRFMMDFGYLILDVSRTTLSGVNRVSVDSGKILIVILFCYFLFKAVEGRGKALAYAALFCISLLIIAYQTRQIVFCALLGILFLWILAQRLHFATAMLGILALGVIVFPFLREQFPDILINMEKRLSSFFFWRNDFYVGDIDSTRMSSIKNVIHLLWMKVAFLWGMGYGAWYSDVYSPFPFLYDERFLSAFDAEWIDTGRFYRVHEPFFHLTFKFGLVGAILFLSLILTPLWRIFRSRLYRSENPWTKMISLVILSSSPIILSGLFWSSKVLMVYAFLIVVSNKVLADSAGNKGAAGFATTY